MAYLPNSDAERREMLDAVGAATEADLFTTIPATLRNPKIDLPPPLAEQDLVAELDRLACAQPLAERVRQLPRRRRIPPLQPRDRPRHDLAPGVLHRVHAVPGRGVAGHPADDLRVPVDDLRAHRARRGQRVDVRRRNRGGRGDGDRGPGQSPHAHRGGRQRSSRRRSRCCTPSARDGASPSMSCRRRTAC